MTLDELRPFGDRLIVRPDPKVEAQGAIVVPDVAKADNPNWFTVSGVVLKLGDGVRDVLAECMNRQCRRLEARRVNGRCSQCGATQADIGRGDRRPFAVQVGDRVTFNRFAGRQIEVEAVRSGGKIPGTMSAFRLLESAERVLILRESEILGVVDGDHELLPGYERPAWDKVTSNDGDSRMVR